MPAVLDACKGNALLTDAGCETNGLGNFDKIHFWRTPVAKCATQTRLRALLSLGLGLYRRPRRSLSDATGRSGSRRAMRDGGREAARWSTAVAFQNVSRHFGACARSMTSRSTIAAGEFFAMLGPSGSGKTTCLRLIAGFDQPTSGHIEIFGETAEGLPPYRRNVNTVFQDYALFPHMNVLDNVGYGLMVEGRRARPSARSRRAKRSAWSNSTVLRRAGPRSSPAASASASRSPARSSTSPKVLLLDEPLGALDLKLREQMQVELKALQRKLGITFVFVTHDQGEALSMADRVAIFNEGQIVQVGAPRGNL